jgi:hypothetical protein
MWKPRFSEYALYEPCNPLPKSKPPGLIEGLARRTARKAAARRQSGESASQKRQPRHPRQRLPVQNATAASSCVPNSDVPVQTTIIAPLFYHQVICVTDTAVTVLVVVKCPKTKMGSHRQTDCHFRPRWRKDERRGFGGLYAGEGWRGREEGVRSE